MAVMNTILTFLLLLAAPDSLRTTPVSLTGGADAPRFWASLLGGGDFYLSRKVGDKARLSERTALVLSFFTTTCIPCRREIPLLDSLQTEFPQIDFFLVNIGEEPALVKNYVQKMQYKMPVLIDRYGQIAKKYQAETTPTLIGVTAEGKIAFVKHGFRESDRKYICRQISLLAEAAATGQ